MVKCETMIYVSKVVSGLFLSFDTLVRLKAVAAEFPIIGSCQFDNKSKLFVQNINSSAESADCVSQTCNCPCRTAVPPRPKSLPFPPAPENIDKMKHWLMDRFKSSTFNICPHRPLQAMSGPPIKIHIDKSAKPRVCNTPAPVPLHWQQQVEEDLRRDEALGILEKVPYGVPVTWCHRMVVTRKQDGSPHQTVDLSPLNKFYRRETHSAESPFHLARRVPGQTWKTVCDAWNGFHSVPLRKEDRHLTTFITHIGRWRYTRAPQGFLSSGDGYNRRFGAVIEDFERKERCIDDTIYYDNELEEH